MKVIRYFSVFLIYAMAILQGIAFVTVPATSILLTNPEYQNLSTAEYGTLFIPMIIGAVVVSGWGGPYANKHGTRRLLLPGIVSNSLAMALFGLTAVTLDYHVITYAILLLSLLALGSGFGATITSLNALTIESFPNKSPTALTSLHAFLGIGTAIGPQLIDRFHAIDQWWLAPFSIAVCMMSLFFCFVLAPALGSHHQEEEESSVPTATSITYPKWLFLFLTITFLYGICETVTGNWGPLYLNQVKELSLSKANTALTAFWLMVTVGRLIVSFATNWLSFRWFYLLLPPMLSFVFLTIGEVTTPQGNTLMMGLAGLACSAMLPLSISFGEQTFPHLREVVSGTFISAYMAGYGVASIGIGAIQPLGWLPLGHLFNLAAFAAMAMTAIVWLALSLFRRPSKA